MIFKVNLTEPHASWFREAYFRFWPEWFNFPTGRDPGPDISTLDNMLLRGEVWPGSPSRVALGWDNMGQTALIFLDTGVGDKLAFCEQAIHELLSLFLGSFVEYHPIGPSGYAYLTSAESEARLTRICELFGQPRSAWNDPATPLHRHVREAVIQTLKEHCADPLLLKTPGNTTEFKLKVLPIMPVGYVHPNPPPFGYSTPTPRWPPVPGSFDSYFFPGPKRYSLVDAWWGGFGSAYGYDKLPVVGAPQPNPLNALVYDVSPGRAWQLPDGKFAFPELTPPEWLELLALLAAPLSGDSSEWPDDQSYPEYAHDPIIGAIVWDETFHVTGNGVFSNAWFTGGYEGFAVPGEIFQPDIPWGSNIGYWAEWIYWPNSHGDIEGHWYAAGGRGGDETQRDWYWREPYSITWNLMEIVVVDIDGNVLASFSGGPTYTTDHGTFAQSLERVEVRGGGVGAFDSDRLAASAVFARVVAGGVWNNEAPTTDATHPGGNYGNPQMDDPTWPYVHNYGQDWDFPIYPSGAYEMDKLLMSDRDFLAKSIDQIQQTTGNMGMFQLHAYALPMTADSRLIPGTPPWPGAVRNPGIIRVGPGLRGSHPTVKAQRGGGRISGAIRGAVG